MSSATVIDALEKRGYITAEGRDRLLQKRASIIVEKIATETAAEVKTAAVPAAKGFGVVDRFGQKAIGGGVNKGWPEWLGDIARLMGVGAGLSAGGAAVGAAANAVSNVAVKHKLKKSKAQVMEWIADQNPEINKQREQVFDAVARYAPTLASDPLIAAGIVQGVQAGTKGRPHVDLNFAKSLAEAETRVNESRNSSRFGKMHEKVHPGLTGQFDFGDKPSRG